MKKAQKAQKTADLSLQNLPSDGTVTAGRAETRAADAPAVDSQQVASASNTAVVDNANGTQISVSAAAHTSTIDDARLSSLERTHDLVAMHALRLTPSGNDTLRVVIEPGGGTSLALELRFNNGGIQAQALLNHGDFEFLSSHWAELQQRLEPRGIHLAALASPTQSATDPRQFQQPGRQSADENPTRSAFADFAFDGSMKDSPAARRGSLKTYNGWETWA